MAHYRFLLLVLAVCLLHAVASPVSDLDSLITARKEESFNDLQFNDHLDTRRPLLASATGSDVDEARAVVRDAIATMTKLNKARLDRPIRDAAAAKFGLNDTQRNEENQPLLQISERIAHAAALVAEADMAASLAKGSTTLVKRAAGSFWMKDIQRQGTVPWGNDPQYKVSSQLSAKEDGGRARAFALSTQLTTQCPPGLSQCRRRLSRRPHRCL